jgi:hypothetical protein
MDGVFLQVNVISVAFLIRVRLSPKLVNLKQFAPYENTLYFNHGP